MSLLSIPQLLKAIELQRTVDQCLNVKSLTRLVNTFSTIQLITPEFINKFNTCHVASGSVSTVSSDSSFFHVVLFYYLIGISKAINIEKLLNRIDLFLHPPGSIGESLTQEEDRIATNILEAFYTPGGTVLKDVRRILINEIIHKISFNVNEIEYSRNASFVDAKKNFRKSIISIFLIYYLNCFKLFKNFETCENVYFSLFYFFSFGFQNSPAGWVERLLNRMERVQIICDLILYENCFNYSNLFNPTLRNFTQYMVNQEPVTPIHSKPPPRLLMDPVQIPPRVVVQPLVVPMSESYDRFMAVVMSATVPSEKPPLPASPSAKRTGEEVDKYFTGTREKNPTELIVRALTRTGMTVTDALRTAHQFLSNGKPALDALWGTVEGPVSPPSPSLRQRLMERVNRLDSLIEFLEDSPVKDGNRVEELKSVRTEIWNLIKESS